MDGIVSALALLIVLYFLMASAMGISAHLKIQRSRKDIRQLGERLTATADAVEKLAEEVASLRAERGRTPAPQADAPLAEPSEPPVAELPEAQREQAAEREAFERSLRGETSNQREAPTSEAPPSARVGGTDWSPGGLEESLTSRWLVWLGAITIALGSIR